VVTLGIKIQKFLTLWRPTEKRDLKKTLKHAWLCAGIAPRLYGLRTWSKRQKTQQVF